MVSDTTRIQGAIRVVDKFGDYGLVGYYCLTPNQKELEHFVFSCRILNIGIEQFIYAHLSFPELTVVGEVIGQVKKEGRPDWILINSSKAKKSRVLAKGVKIYFKGGCDLSQMLHYIKEQNCTIIEETNYVSRRNMPIHAEHTQVLLNAQHVDDVKMESLVNSVPFVDEQFFNTKVFEASYDVLIYSVLMDYTQELYKNKNDNSLLPFGGYQFVLTDESHHEKIVGIYKARGLHLINNDFLRSFTAQYEHIGQITPEHFKLNLEKLRKSIPSEIPIIFVNGSEVDTPNPHEENAPLRHRIMNKALDEFISKSFNCYLLDVRKVITSNDQVEDNIRHYKREMHFNLAGELKKLMEDQIGISLVVNRTTMFSRIKVKIQRRIRNILNKVRF